MKVDDELIEEFLKGIHNFNAFHVLSSEHRKFKPLGMSVIRCLVGGPPGIGHRPRELKPSEIARIMGVKQPTITPLLYDLENEGIITRRPNPDDRREVYIALTDKALEMHKKHHERMHESVGELVRYLGVEDSKEILRIAEKIKQFYALKNQHKETR